MSTPLLDNFLIYDGVSYYCPYNKSSDLSFLPQFIGSAAIQQTTPPNLFDFVGYYKGCNVYLTYPTDESEEESGHESIHESGYESGCESGD